LNWAVATSLGTPVNYENYRLPEEDAQQTQMYVFVVFGIPIIVEVVCVLVIICILTYNTEYIDSEEVSA